MLVQSHDRKCVVEHITMSTMRVLCILQKPAKIIYKIDIPPAMRASHSLWISIEHKSFVKCWIRTGNLASSYASPSRGHKPESHETDEEATL